MSGPLPVCLLVCLLPLPVYLSVCLSVPFLSVCLSLSLCLSVCLPVCVGVSVGLCLPAIGSDHDWSVCLSTSPSLHVPVCSFMCLSVCMLSWQYAVIGLSRFLCLTLISLSPSVLANCPCLSCLFCLLSLFVCLSVLSVCSLSACVCLPAMAHAQLCASVYLLFCWTTNLTSNCFPLYPY